MELGGGEGDAHALGGGVVFGEFDGEEFVVGQAADDDGFGAEGFEEVNLEFDAGGVGGKIVLVP